MMSADSSGRAIDVRERRRKNKPFVSDGVLVLTCGDKSRGRLLLLARFFNCFFAVGIAIVDDDRLGDR